jgi:hypothetical protein
LNIQQCSDIEGQSLNRTIYHRHYPHTSEFVASPSNGSHSSPFRETSETLNSTALASHTFQSVEISTEGPSHSNVDLRFPGLTRPGQMLTKGGSGSGTTRSRMRGRPRRGNSCEGKQVCGSSLVTSWAYLAPVVCPVRVSHRISPTPGCVYVRQGVPGGGTNSLRRECVIYAVR